MKKDKKKIIGYGAPAKATTALNYFNISKEIEYIIEDNKLKHGKFIPGVNIPIKSKKEMKDKNNTVLVLAWNFYDEIIKNNNFEKEKCINIKSLAIEIHNNYKPTVLVGIMRGAAPILDILSRILKLPIAYIVIQSYSGKGMEDKQGQLMFAREISSLAENKDFDKVLLVDDLSDTGLTLNKSIEWLKNYEPTKDYINEVKTACLWKKKSSTFEPDFCPVKLNSDPWIVQPTEHYEEMSMEEIIKRNK